MLPDHYATLGIAPMSTRARIRAAYVELMRIYHPDRNPSAAAAARVRAITAAYAVLSVCDKRAQYDLSRSRVGIAQSSGFAPERTLQERWLPIPVGITAVIFFVALLLPPSLIQRASSDQVLAPVGGEAILAQQPVGSATASELNAHCMSPATSSLVKRELFRRAAQLRGSEEAAYDRLSRNTVLRFDSPVAHASGEPGTVNCTVSVALDLPPGVATHIGRRSVTDRIGYFLQAVDAGAARPIGLTTEGAIIEVLATLTQTTSSQSDEVDPSAAPNQEFRSGGSPPLESSPLPAQPAAPAWSNLKPQRSLGEQSPSFSCRFARNWATMSVCESPTLAALDRRMASLYGDSMEPADAATRARLLQSDGQFLARRDQCSSESCVQSAYLAAIQDIRDITASP